MKHAGKECPMTSEPMPCPRCHGTNTRPAGTSSSSGKPLRFCRECQRTWTVGGTRVTGQIRPMCPRCPEGDNTRTRQDGYTSQGKKIYFCTRCDRSWVAGGVYHWGSRRHKLCPSCDTRFFPRKDTTQIYCGRLCQ